MSKFENTKEGLINNINATHAQLEKKYASLTPQQMVWQGSMDDWSVKDILAHLADWEQRFISWYRAGVAGEFPETPAPGMTWRDLARLNQQGYELHKDETLEQVLEQYEKSFQEITALIEAMTEEEIFEPGVYAWTGKSALLPWIDANTASHYRWAERNIRARVIQKAFS
jgi:hypothetical protein